ncbi:MAG: hypothetical protein H0X63_02160 [Flavobacteriales bacterium]|jgi:hypothetical protein|nr:hypothetical protein [Flavobacteriales bacterium]
MSIKLLDNNFCAYFYKMKKILLSFLLSISFSFSNANELFKLVLSENQKLENTYSVSLSNNATFHLATIKNSKSKKHELISYYITSEKQVKQLEKLVLEDIPNIISYHKSGEEITFITYNIKDKDLAIIDFNIVSGKHKIKTIQNQKKTDHIFRLDDKTIMVYSNKKLLEVIEINNSQSQSEKRIKLSGENEKKFQKFLLQKPQEINQNEYVKNGSIEDARVYLTNDENIVFTKVAKNNSIDLMVFNMTSESINASEINFDEPDIKYKDFNTYLQNDNLFAILNNNDNIVLKNYNLADKTHKETLSIKENLAQIKTKSEYFEEFLKEARKSKMKPTITF